MDMSYNYDFVLHSEFKSWWELPEETNVANYILRRAREHARSGREICIENYGTGETLLYDDIDTVSAKIASKLSKLGLQSGETVIYSTHDPAKVHVFMVGVWRANGIVRSCYPEDLGDTLETRIKESRASFIACDKAFAPECILAANAITEWKVQIIIFGDAGDVIEGCLSIHDFYNDDGYSLPSFPGFTSSLHDIALILPTSGTTGDSKGAIYTHKILLENLMAHENMPYTDRNEEPTIITSRQTHYVGSVVVLSCITRGRRVLMMSDVTIERLLNAVEKCKVRAIIAFPSYLTGMMKHPDVGKFDLSSLHFLAAAGQVIVPESMAVIRTLPNLKTFINLYGMTECGLMASSANWTLMREGIAADLPCKDYSVGKLPPNTALQVIDIETGLPLGANCRGELCFKSVVTTAGYLCRPEAEAQTFFRSGWVKTGDIGHYDQDGFIYVVDRAKEVFKWHNNHICPSEVENVLLRHSSVFQAVVIGVPGRYHEGSVPRAFIVLREGEEVTEDELIEFAANNLPTYKHLKGGLFIIPELPVGKTGKVIRTVLSQIQLPLLKY